MGTYEIPVVRVQLVRDSAIAANAKRITSAETAYEIARQRLEFSDREVFLVMHVDSKNRVVSVETAFTGTINAAVTSMREIFKGAILANATAIIVAHNHPSGDPAPSPEDIMLTANIAKAGELLDIPLLDHIIIGSNCFISLKQRGLL